MPGADRGPRCLSAEELLQILHGEADEAARPRMEAHLGACPVCGAALEEIRTALSAYQRLPIDPPSPEAFETMVRRATSADRASRAPLRVSPGMAWWPIAAAAAVVIAVAAGFALVRWSDHPGTGPPGLSAASESVLQALASGSANVRLEGVVRASGIPMFPEDVMRRLIEMLESDPSVNVRLAVIDALRDRPASREHATRIIAAIRHQEIPLARKSLIELLVALDLRQARESLEAVARTDASGSVRDRARWALEQLS